MADSSRPGVAMTSRPPAPSLPRQHRARLRREGTGFRSVRVEVWRVDVAKHELPEGYTLAEVEWDLWGRITQYEVEGTRYFLTRTGTGWRAQLAPHGRARRRYVGPGWENPRQAVRYLMRFGYIRTSPRDPATGQGTP